MSFDITDAFVGMQAIESALKQVVDSLSNIPEIKKQFIADGLIEPDKKK